MSMITGKAKTPPIIQAAETPTPEAESVKAADQNERSRAAANSQREEAIATSSEGDTSTANIKKKNLLGNAE